MLQSNIWMNSLKASTVHGDPSEWGWKKNSFGQFTPFWSNLPAAVSLVPHFVKCFCTKHLFSRDVHANPGHSNVHTYENETTNCVTTPYLRLLHELIFTHL